MHSVRWQNLSLKYQRFTPSGGKHIGIRKCYLEIEWFHPNRESLDSRQIKQNINLEFQTLQEEN